MKIYYVLFEEESKFGIGDTNIKLFRKQSDANEFAAKKLVEREGELEHSIDESDLKEAKEALAQGDYETVLDLIYNEDVMISYQEI